MEDAMIINKSSFERGFGYGTIYKSDFVDLKEMQKNSGSVFIFGIIRTGDNLANIGMDGMPYVGTRLNKGDVLCV